MKTKVWILTVCFMGLLGITMIASALTTFLEDFDGNQTLDGWGKHLQSGDLLEVSANWAYESQYSMHIRLDGYSPEIVQYSMGIEATEIATLRMGVNTHEAYVKMKVYMVEGINNLAGDKDCLMWIYFWGTRETPTGPQVIPLASVGQVRLSTDYGTLNIGSGQNCWCLALAHLGTGNWYSVELGWIRGTSAYAKIGSHTIFKDSAHASIPAVNITMIEVGLIATRHAWSGNVIEGYVDNVEVRANGISPSQPTPPNGGNGNGNGNQTEGWLPDWLQGILGFLGVDLMAFLLIVIVVILVFIMLFRTGR